MKRIAILVSTAPALATLGQPTSFTDLGSHTTIAETFEVPVHLLAGNDIQWFRIELPAVGASTGFVDFGNYLDRECCLPSDIDVPQIGVYDNIGNLLPRVNILGPNNSEHYSYGLLDPRPRPAHNGQEQEGGFPHAGQSGTLAQGVYWVAIGNLWVGFNPAGWSVFSNTPPDRPQRIATLRFRIQPPGLPYCDPDLNWDGNADEGDVAYLLNVLAGGENPTGRFPDYNRDGNEDQDDLAALVNTIAGGGCP